MTELAKAFESNLIEDKWSAFWQESNCLRADPYSVKPAFSLVMPPPNVTGVLHMGHALVNTLQDVLTRWKRMQGFEVLWVPGTDHAGIATQTVVERNLIAQTGKRRKDFSREEFLSHVWDWKEKSQDSILMQLKKLGCSCDWSRLCFTMDPQRNTAVKAAFKKFYDDGLIYRGDYLVNWDPVTQTALADDEVEHEEKESFLWHFRYPLETDPSQFITVATTRPETMLGDVAVAVNPSDTRYSHLIGKQLLLPITRRLVPIIADYMVEIGFGTGAVKITPAHDPNDYEMAKRHDLPMINIMTPDGKINEQGLEFQGLTMQEARAEIVETMRELGLLEKIEPHKLRIGISYRSKAIIEPYLSKQWFVKMSSFKPILRNLVETKQIKIIPDQWESTYFHWIDNLRDWCISRQLWWGHRIPIWYNKEQPEQMICYAGEDLPPEVLSKPEDWAQDEDVLDTWFSSALWPFSTMGWPHHSAELKKFYPSSTLITGHDILFFWVARMVLMGSYLTEQAPFAETFLHGLIYGKSYWKTGKDGSISYITGQERLSYDLGKPIPAGVQYKWEKMSKSKGNVIDPLEIIKDFGTDAMRMALCASATQARQIDLDRRRFEEFKNFANKVWNGARFVFMNIESLTKESFAQGLDIHLLTLEDKWILSLLNRTIQEVNLHLTNYHFDKAALTAYDFFWKEFCAYYLELSKPILSGKVDIPAQKVNKQKILSITLCSLLRLIHPMTPFITEELFSCIKDKFAGMILDPSADAYTQEAHVAMQAACCMQAPYPTVVSLSDINIQIESTFTFMNTLVHAIRNIRAEMQLPPATSSDVYVIGATTDPYWISAQENRSILQALVKIDTLTFTDHAPLMTFSAETLVDSLKIMIPLPPEMREKEKQRLIKEQDKLSHQSSSMKEKLASPEFLQKAPAEVVNKLSSQLLQIDKQIAEMQEKYRLLSA
ncbi:MAG: valine--tRNA ligase [Chlamydiae bacterium]|nr:valine--tRNA ligase [Chlamydiota bacterium]